MPGELNQYAHRPAVHVLEHHHRRLPVDVAVEILAQQDAVFFPHEVGRTVRPPALAVVGDPPLFAFGPPDGDRLEQIRQAFCMAQQGVEKLLADGQKIGFGNLVDTCPVNRHLIAGDDRGAVIVRPQGQDIRDRDIQCRSQLAAEEVAHIESLQADVGGHYADAQLTVLQQGHGRFQRAQDLADHHAGAAVRRAAALRGDPESKRRRAQGGRTCRPLIGGCSRFSRHESLGVMREISWAWAVVPWPFPRGGTSREDPA